MDKFLKSVNKSQITDKQKEITNKTINSKLEDKLIDLKVKFNLKMDKLENFYIEFIKNKGLFLKDNSSLKLEELFEDVKTALFSVDTYSMFDVFTEKISSIYHHMIEFYNSLLKENDFDDVLNDMIDFFEKSFYLFIFHFNSSLDSLGLELIKILYITLDFSFHKEMVQKLVDLIRLFMTKRQLNLLLCNRFIYNLSLSINMALHYSNDETKRFFLNSVINNTNDGIMISYFICNATNNQFNFSKFYPLDILSNLTDKLSKDLDKQMNQFEILINELNKQKNTIVKNKIKQVLNTISSIAKITDSFLIRGNRTYNYSKIIGNLLKSIKNLWDLLLIADIQEIEFSIESIQNLIIFYENLENLSFEKKLILFAVVSKLCEANIKYTINMFTVVQSLFNRINRVPQNSEKDIVIKVFTIIENHLEGNKSEKCDFLTSLYFKVILDILLAEKNFDDQINFFPNIKEFYNTFDLEKIPYYLRESIFTSSLKDYYSLLDIEEYALDKKLKMKLAIERLKDYKNSLKDLFDLQSSNFCIDNKIENYLESLENTKEKLKENEIEVFLLDSSIQLYKEIIQNTMKK